MTNVFTPFENCDFRWLMYLEISFPQTGLCLMLCSLSSVVGRLLITWDTLGVLRDQESTNTVTSYKACLLHRHSSLVDDGHSITGRSEMVDELVYSYDSSKPDSPAPFLLWGK